MSGWGLSLRPEPVFRYAKQLADAPADQERIRSLKLDVSFLDYDWKLNDAR